MSKLKMCVWPLLTLIVFAVTLFFNYPASTGVYSDKDVGEVSDEYELQITPASWTFTIWAFIYLWQATWIIYILYLTCRYSMKMVVFGIPFYIFYNFANIGNVAWIVIWTNEYILPAAVLLILVTSSLLSTAFLAHKYIFITLEKATMNSNYGGVESDEENEEWINNGKSIRSLIYIFVLNGVPFYATWTVVASHLNIGIALCYKAGMTNTNASFLMLSILTCVILFYWFLDFYRLRKYLQYTYSPYIVLIIAFTGSLTNGGLNVEERPASPFILALLITAVLGTIAKVIMGLIMCRRGVQSFETV